MNGAAPPPPAAVLFAGDSITDADRSADAEGLGHGYVRELAAGPLRGARVVNAGVGGGTAADLEARWERDVLSADAGVVSIYVGINDSWRYFDHAEKTSAGDFEATYRRLLDPLLERGTRLVLVEPFVVPVSEEQLAWDADLAPKQEVVARLSREAGAVFVGLREPLAQLADSIGAVAVAEDGVHPTPRGHREIARLWWSAFSEGGR